MIKQVECASCGATLSWRAEAPAILVDPCQHCVTSAVEQAQDEASERATKAAEAVRRE